MARITVEDCIDKFESRFELVLVASNRARKLHSGENPTVEKDNDKPTVIALREIADESLSIDSLKDKLIQEYQTVSPLDEEELSLNYDGLETESNDLETDDESQSNEQDDENTTPKEIDSNEVESENISHSKSDEYSDISDNNNTES
jgi:DNA-directed RNA polymerase subunit omega